MENRYHFHTGSFPVKELMVTWPDMIGWSPPAWIPTSAYCQSHRILTVLLFLWCSMDPINVSPLYVSIYIYIYHTWILWDMMIPFGYLT